MALTQTARIVSIGHRSHWRYGRGIRQCLNCFKYTGYQVGILPSGEDMKVDSSKTATSYRLVLLAGQLILLVLLISFFFFFFFIISIYKLLVRKFKFIIHRILKELLPRDIEVMFL
ncbi:hypothetical protein VN97_g1000 [Penicillium thymicola]|uniref:Uncharacterized protein n=1 Tax=Penicillium thymicola TaxID=293382 RepID=A0AAI9TRS9_PENTH|nr:hypothetical protein VN97_g1000 [Penicillium thymicola]